MSHDIRAFNVKWLDRLIHGQLSPGLVNGVPPVGVDLNKEAVSEIACRMTSTFAKLALPVEEIRHALSKDDYASPQDTHSLQAVSLIQEWLSIARLKSKDVLGGHYPSLLQMHLVWEDVSFFAGLSNADICRIAIRLGSSNRFVLGWAWPNFLGSAGNVHPNLYQSYAFALTA